MSTGKQQAKIQGRPSRRAAGCAVLLMLATNAAFSAKADSAELPVPAKEAAQPSPQMHKTCVGTDGKPYRWDQANVPFASSCHMEEDKQATPPQPQPGAK